MSGSDELINIPMGLKAFSEEPSCPKCRSTAVQTHWHVAPTFQADPVTPCEQWLISNLLTLPVGEHLCRYCHTCRYGWPEQTADS